MRRRRRIRWLIGLLLVTALVVAAVLAVVGSANRRQADDPRSPIATGAGALGQLLSDQGVQITTTSRVEDAAAAVDPTTTLVVANADQLDEVAAGRLLTAGAARVILLRPNTPALVTFEVRATARTARGGLLRARLRGGGGPPGRPDHRRRPAGQLPGDGTGRLRLLSHRRRTCLSADLHR